MIEQADKKLLESAVKKLDQAFKAEYSVADKDIKVELEFEDVVSKQVLSFTSLTKVIFYLRNVPNGVQNMSQVMPGLVETSLNAGILKLTEEKLNVIASVRSSVSTRKDDLLDKLTMLAEFIGGEVNVSGDYPAWEYVKESDIRDTISDVYRELFDEEPVFEAIHAGLECGILSGKIDNLDCVSFGPDNFDIHTPNERLSISSTEKVWKLIVEFLKRCK